MKLLINKPNGAKRELPGLGSLPNLLSSRSDYTNLLELQQGINEFLVSSRNSVLTNTRIFFLSESQGNDKSGKYGVTFLPFKTMEGIVKSNSFRSGDVIFIQDYLSGITVPTALAELQELTITVSKESSQFSLQYSPEVNNFKFTLTSEGVITKFSFVSTEDYYGVCKVVCDIFDASNTFFTWTNGEVEILCNTYTGSNAGWGTMTIGGYNSNPVDDDGLVRYLIINANYLSAPQEHWIGWRYVYNTHVRVNVNILELGASASIFSMYNSYTTNSSFIYNINLLIAPNTNFLVYWSSVRNPFNNIMVRINIGYYKGPASIFGQWGPGDHISGQGVNCRFVFHCDFFHSTRETQSVIRNITNNEKYSRNYFFEISGYYISDLIPILHLTVQMLAMYKLSGTFITPAGIPAISITSINSLGRLNLENAKFKVGVTEDKVIEATSAVNVYCMNVVTNSTTTDAEVTEVGQAIVRNSNFI